jgi:predicted Zn-dependent protease
MVGLAALILGILAASRTGNADMANAAIMGSQGIAVQGQLNFSRDMEREADRMGYGTLGAAGFSTAAMAAMFEKLDTANRLNDNGSFPYLRSHPLTVERMAEARSRALFGGRALTPPSLRHVMMQARAKVIGERNVQGLQRFEEQATGQTGIQLRERLAAAYAGALAASINRNAPLAEKAAAEAVQLAMAATPRDPQAERTAQLLLAQVRLDRGDAALALKTLDAIADAPTSRPALLLRAQAQLDLQRQQGAVQAAALRQSTETLQTWVADHPQDAAAWALLAQSADAVGLKLRALRAGAEARAAIGDLNGAIDRLRAGQGAARGAAGQDFIEASVIDARLRELQGQRRALALEARGGRSTDKPEEPPPQ